MGAEDRKVQPQAWHHQLIPDTLLPPVEHQERLSQALGIAGQADCLEIGVILRATRPGWSIPPTDGATMRSSTPASGIDSAFPRGRERA